MKDITHYFRPSRNDDKHSEELLRVKECGKANSSVECRLDTKDSDCELYLSDSENESDAVTNKVNPYLQVQIAGISACKSSLRKRKRVGARCSNGRKSKRLEFESPVSQRRNVNGDNEALEESFYMSPLRLDSDSSPDRSPPGNTAHSQRLPSPFLSKTKKSNRITKNLLTLSKNNTANSIYCPQQVTTSVLASPVKKERLYLHGDSSGSLHKYFGNASANKSGNHRNGKHTEVAVINLIEESSLSLPESPKLLEKSGPELKNVSSRRKRQKDATFNGITLTKNNSDAINDTKTGTSSASKNVNKNNSDSPQGNSLLNYFDKSITPSKSKRKNRRRKNKRKVKSKARENVSGRILALSPKGVTSADDNRNGRKYSVRLNSASIIKKYRRFTHKASASSAKKINCNASGKIHDNSSEETFATGDDTIVTCKPSGDEKTESSTKVGISRRKSERISLKIDSSPSVVIEGIKESSSLTEKPQCDNHTVLRERRARHNKKTSSGLASTYPEPEDKRAFVESQMYDYHYDSSAMPEVYDWPQLPGLRG